MHLPGPSFSDEGRDDRDSIETAFTFSESFTPALLVLSHDDVVERTIIF